MLASLAVQRAEDLAKLGRMERLNHLAATFENKIGVVVSALSGAANEMQAASTSLNSTAEQTNRQSMAVASEVVNFTFTVLTSRSTRWPGMSRWPRRSRRWTGCPATNGTGGTGKGAGVS